MKLCLPSEATVVLTVITTVLLKWLLTPTLDTKSTVVFLL